MVESDSYYIQALSTGPGAPKFQLYQFQPGNQRIQVKKFINTSLWTY